MNERDKQYEREKEKARVETQGTSEEYERRFGEEKVDWLLITDYEYDHEPNGDQRR